jgi:hypothetical protein
MKPILFPFTVMTEAQRTGFHRFFKQITVLQPCDADMPEEMLQWEADAAIEILRPPPDGGEISAVLEEFRLWRQRHAGGDVSVFKYTGDRVPFFSDASVSQIKKEIRTTPPVEQRKEAASQKDAAARLFQARLFLQMAQEFDAENLEIAESLTVQSRMEQGLFNRLKGNELALDDCNAQRSEQPPDDPFEYMLRDRLRAWARVMLSLEIDTALFITPKRNVVEMILNHGVVAEAGIYRQIIGALAQDRKQLLEHLQQLARASWSKDSNKTATGRSATKGEENIQLELYIISDLAPADFLRQLSGKSEDVIQGPTCSAQVRHTMIGLVETGA